MAISFQLEEMIHQDIDGVIFRAVHAVDGSPLAVRRFFLPEAQLERLREEDEEGVSLFMKGVAELIALDTPNLRRVLAGGFDDLDGTPYIVTEWVEGATLSSCRDRGELRGQDLAPFQEQAHAVLGSLRVELRGALLLAGDQILVSRSPAGDLQASFLLSPRDYFGAIGGAPARTSDQEQSLIALSAFFPKEDQVATPEVSASPTPESKIESAVVPLKSAQGGSGVGLLWVSGVLVVMMLVGGIWWLFKPSADEAAASSVAREEAPSQEGGVVMENEKGSEVAEPVSEEPELTKSDADEPDSRFEPEIAESTPEPEKDVVEEVDPPVEEVPAEEPVLAAATDSDVERETDSADVAIPAEPEKAVEAQQAPPEFGPYDVEKLARMDGEMVTIFAPVIDTVSSSSGNWWYLDFGGGSRSAYVVFREKDDFPELTFSDWEKFRLQNVRVTGIFNAQGRGKFGSKAELAIQSLSAIEVVLPPRVYELSDWQDLLTEVGEGEEVLFEGKYRSFLQRDGAVYLLFEEGLEVAARFQVGGPLSNQQFSEQMKALEGQRVRVSAPVSKGPEGRIEVVFELTNSSQFAVPPVK